MERKHYIKHVSGTEAALWNLGLSSLLRNFSTVGWTGCVDSELLLLLLLVFFFWRLGSFPTGSKASSSSLSLEKSALMFFQGRFLRVGILSSAPINTPLGLGMRGIFGSGLFLLGNCSLCQPLFFCPPIGDWGHLKRNETQLEKAEMQFSNRIRSFLLIGYRVVNGPTSSGPNPKI